MRYVLNKENKIKKHIPTTIENPNHVLNQYKVCTFIAHMYKYHPFTICLDNDKT